MKLWQIIFLILLIVGSIFVITRNAPYKKNSGKIFGTYYNIIYQSEKELHDEINATLQAVDNSLSTFNSNSTITAINNNADIAPDEKFLKIFALAQRISAETDGAFDITVAPLVNAWGFGFRKNIPADSATIDSLHRFVGYNTVEYKDGRIVKKFPETMLDCSAIAKGFGCDEVARTLEKHGVSNYMVEIGGEVVAKGVNDKGKKWVVGITKPTDDRSGTSTELQEIIRIGGKSLATSGNYRNFRYEGKRKVAHTIDPKSGYPVTHSLLSATVIADDCATADALATAFMVMGMEKSIEFCNNHDEIDAIFIYNDEQGNLLTKETAGIEKYR